MATEPHFSPKTLHLAMSQSGVNFSRIRNLASLKSLEITHYPNLTSLPQRDSQSHLFFKVYDFEVGLVVFILFDLGLLKVT